MTTVYFYDGEQCKKFMAFGQMLELMWACYIKGKELDYDDIYIEWHDRISITWFDDGSCIAGMKTPMDEILPLKIVPKGTTIFNAHKYIDISEPNVLYDGCPPLISNYKIKGSCYEEYLSRNYKATNIKPKIEIRKEEVEDKYILIHYRHSKQKRQLLRNIPEDYFINIINLIREHYSDYKIYKIGEPSRFDKFVDKRFKLFLFNTDGLLSLVANSSLYIGPLSGPISIAFFSQHPCIGILSDHDIKIGYTETRDYYSPDTIFVSIHDDYLKEMKKFMDKIL